MKVAFATQDGEAGGRAFGWAKNCGLRYRAGLGSYKFLEVIQFEGDLKEDGDEDKSAPKIDAIRDCAILYVAAIGGSGCRARGRGGCSSDKGDVPGGDYRPSRKACGRCSNPTPPPGLPKAMLKGQERVLHLEDEAVDG